MNECIFCKIVEGEVPSKKIYEDKKVLAFLDINPISAGHILVVPKKHSSDVFEISEKEMGDIGKVIKIVSTRVKEILKPDGIYIRQNNGEAAGQVVFHYHAHIVPVYDSSKNLSLDEVEDLLAIKES
ncbi:MAG: HIT family protein [Candidatus Dojkabacteria bacterium]